jgi:hypothetical protein
MTNEHYLIVSYFVSAGVSLVLGTLVYFFLRRSFGEVASTVSGKNFPTILKRLFPVGLVFPALMGFISVSYLSCDHETYAKIVKSKDYLVQKNQEQVATTLFALVVAILFWDLVLVFVQKYAQKPSGKTQH